MATQNARELQEFQSRLSDANTVVEKHNQGLDEQDIDNEMINVHGNNEIEEESLNNLFNTRQEREAELKQVDQVNQYTVCFQILGHFSPNLITFL